MKKNRLSVSKSLLVGMLGCVSLCSMPANGQDVIFEDDKMVGMSGHSSNEDFGRSVAIGGGIIAVGSHKDQVNGDRSGSVYLFDAETGNQLSKIVPSDGERNDAFGYAVAIDNGILAVSAPQFTLTTENKNGKIYLYDIETGAHLRTVIGSDSGHPNTITGLGKHIAMDNGIIAASAEGDSANGLAAGAVYLFDVSTGAEITKLLAGDGSDFARFGWSVSIHNDIVAVGAPTARRNGALVGTGYLFDAKTGNEIFQLDSVGGSDFQRFGESVAVGNRFVAIATEDFFNNNFVYLFDIKTGEVVVAFSLHGHSLSIANGVLAVGNQDQDQVHLISISSFLEFAVLETSDSPQNDQFGISIDAENGTFVVGANFDDDRGTDAGAAYLYKGVPIDTDSDGLLDDWEINGIPYTDINGSEQRFILPGADPEYKDVYVEMDTMAGISTGSSLDSDLVQAFAFAPVGNPDGFDGIAFHLLQDDSSITHIPEWLTDGCWPLDFAAKRAANFGTALERSNESSTALLEAKAMAYRYCIVADRALPNNIGGCGQRPGDNFVLFLGSGAYTDINIAADFMHEMGHNFGLQHGGGDGVNGKPNYPSIMNYVMSYKYNWNQAFWQLDYSRRGNSEFDLMDEGFLDENVGVGKSSGLYNDFLMPFGYNELSDTETIRKIGYVRLDGSATDFGTIDDHSGLLDGAIDIDVIQDLNYAVNAPSGIAIPGVASPEQIFKPYNDWINVHLKLAAANGASAPVPSFATDELTNEAREWIDTNFPAPPSVCQADLTGEGVLDFFDVSAFLQGFANQDPISDFTGDGIWDFFDVSAFLQAFAGGCP